MWRRAVLSVLCMCFAVQNKINWLRTSQPKSPIFFLQFQNETDSAAAVLLTSHFLTHLRFQVFFFASVLLSITHDRSATAPIKQQPNIFEYRTPCVSIYLRFSHLLAPKTKPKNCKKCMCLLWKHLFAVFVCAAFSLLSFALFIFIFQVCVYLTRLGFFFCWCPFFLFLSLSPRFLHFFFPFIK